MNKNFLNFCSALFLTLFSFNTYCAVWDATRAWDSSWEDEYSNWVEISFNEDIFLKGPYKGISTDCADAVYAARIIFAYENSLPFAIKDPTGGRNLITNKMSRFDSNSSSSRLRKFINFVSQVTSTKTLPNDSFPVEINRAWVRAGGIFSRPRANASRIIFGIKKDAQPGHADLIKNISETGVIYLIGSTVPAAVRELKTTSNFVFLPQSHETGIRFWLKPNQYGKPLKSIPGYSLEQYSLGKPEKGHPCDRSNNNKKRTLNSWTSAVTSRLKLKDEDKESMKYRFAENFCETVKERVEVVKRSERVRRKISRCMNEYEYDLYSTPSRDAKILQNLKKLIKLNTFWGMVTKNSVKKVSIYLESCPNIEYMPGKIISMTEFALRLSAKRISSDPNQPIEARWGEYKAKNLGCKIYY